MSLVTAFANRLEDLLSKAVQLGKVESSSQNEMLVSALRSGITTNLKMFAGYKFDSFKHFDQLRVELRRTEEEMARDTQPCTLISGTSPKSSSKEPNTDKLTGMVQQLQKDMSSLNKKFSDSEKHLEPQHEDRQQEAQSDRHDQQYGSEFHPRSSGRGRGRGNRPYRQWQPPEWQLQSGS